MFVCESLDACFFSSHWAHWTSLNACCVWRQWPCNLCKHHRKSIYIYASSLEWLFYQLQNTFAWFLQRLFFVLWVHYRLYFSVILNQKHFLFGSWSEWQFDLIIVSISHSWDFFSVMHVLNLPQRGYARTCPVLKNPTLQLGQGLSLCSHGARL